LNTLFPSRPDPIGVCNGVFTMSVGPEINDKHGHHILKTVRSEKKRRFQKSQQPLYSVNAIIFLAPISAFDQVLAEVGLLAFNHQCMYSCSLFQDPRVNRLEDSLILWKSVVSNKLLKNVSIVLFLNKCDLLRVCFIPFASLLFPDYIYCSRN